MGIYQQCISIDVHGRNNTLSYDQGTLSASESLKGSARLGVAVLPSTEPKIPKTLHVDSIAVLGHKTWIIDPSSLCEINII